MRGLTAVLATVAIVGLAITAHAAPAQPSDVAAATLIRSLAENVLGSGLIRALSVTESGATVLMRWEAATYRSKQKPEETREQLFGEAELVTGSIMGGMRSVSRIRFTMSRRDGQILASGVNARGPGVSLIYSALLGGGTRTSGTPAPEKTSPNTGGGTTSAKD